MKFNYNDGGRTNEGFKQKKHCGDCVCRAIAIATQRPYSEIYGLILHYAKQERTSKRTRKQGFSDPEKGVYRATSSKIISRERENPIPLGLG